MIKAGDVKAWRKSMEGKEDKQRISTSKELYKVFSHEWMELLQERLRSLFSEQVWEDLRLQADISLNILRWAADEQAAIYSQSPTRSIEGVEPVEGEDPLDPYTSGGLLDLALDQAARLCYACREVAIRPLSDISGRPRIVLDVIPTHRVFVVPSEEDITKPSLVVITKSDGSFVAWDNEEQVKVSKSWEVLEREPNPYKMIPYVIAHASYPTVQFWQTMEALGLLEATYQIAQSKTEYNHLRRLQSHKQGWYRSDTEVPTNVLTDPASWIQVQGDGEVGLLDLQANLKENLETILSAAAATLALYGIRPESVSGTLDASSGYALSIKLLAQERVWGQQRRVWEVWEQQLYNVSRAVLSVDAKVELPEGKLNIDWAEIGAKATPLDKAALHKELLEMGVVSPQWVQQKMGMSPAEIEQIEDDILEAGAGRMVPPPMPMPEPESIEGGE